MFKKSSFLALALGVVVFCVSSCGQNQSPVDASDASFGGKPTKTTNTSTVISGTGVVHVMTNASGLKYYGIETAAGVRYEVLNFPSGAFADGQTVKFTGYLVSGYTMGNNYGQPLMLSAISAG
jgi:hypothetical protein